jgi:AraC-like DNA-binding protein
MDWSPGYREWAPPAGAAAALACLWVRVAGGAGTTTLVLPDGCVDLIWQRGRAAFVAGPDTGPAPSPLGPGTILFGARFLPGAGGAALGLPLVELRDRRVDLAELDPELSRNLSGELSPEDAAHRVTEEVLRMTAVAPPDPAVTAAARLLAWPYSRTNALASTLGISERHLRRRFDVAVGYGPKTLQRVMRFRRFLRELTTGLADRGLADAALGAGYVDQAHLTRETVRLAGRSPAVLRAELLRERRMRDAGPSIESRPVG